MLELFFENLKMGPSYLFHRQWVALEKEILCFERFGGPEKGRLGCVMVVYLELVYLVTALVPSETACLASSPGRRSLTAVWISREVMVDLLL